MTPPNKSLRQAHRSDDHSAEKTDNAWVEKQTQVPATVTAALRSSPLAAVQRLLPSNANGLRINRSPGSRKNGHGTRRVVSGGDGNVVLKEKKSR
jgi:hypothetical protein